MIVSSVRGISLQMKAIRRTREIQANLSRVLIKTWTTKMIIYSKVWCVLIIEQEKIPTRETRALNGKKFPFITRHRHIPGSWVFFFLFSYVFLFSFRWWQSENRRGRHLCVCVCMWERKRWRTTTLTYANEVQPQVLLFNANLPEQRVEDSCFITLTLTRAPIVRKQQCHQHYHWRAFFIISVFTKQKK